MPAWVRYTMMILAAAALLPLAVVVRSRSVRSELPRIHIVQDMDNQLRFKSQQQHPGFADRRAMRLPVSGTVARGHLEQDDHYYRGINEDDYATSFPMPVTMELLERGRERYAIFCAPCHGLSGYGDGIVARRADAAQQATWVPPTSLHDELAYSRPPGHLFNTITSGIRSMPSYGSQIPVEDRWAIVSYVIALQRSQHAGPEDVPPDRRSSIRAEEVQP